MTDTTLLYDPTLLYEPKPFLHDRSPEEMP